MKELPIVVAEIGINHNGSLDFAKMLIDLSKKMGVEYVKFQKRTPEICVPKDQRNIVKDTPFGPMKYFEYKKRIEFGKKEFDEIDAYCKQLDMKWFASAWDDKSVEFLEQYNMPFIKIASACITDFDLMKRIKETNTPVIISTGMSTQKQVSDAVNYLGEQLEYILYAKSTYPTEDKHMNMSTIYSLQKEFGGLYNIGFSNHSMKIIYTVQAYIMGAKMLEFHITLDRAMKGTDHKASVGPVGFDRIMKHLNSIADGWGDGELNIIDAELPLIKKLRRVQ